MENPGKFQADADSIYTRMLSDPDCMKTGLAGRDSSRVRVDAKTGCMKVRFLRPVLPFTHIRQWYVVADCRHNYTGPYRDKGDSLRFSACTGSHLKCAPGKADAVTDAYFYSTDRYSFRGEDTLVLHNPFNNALIFKADEVYY